MPDPNSNSVSLTACDVPNTYPEKKPEKPAAAANDNSDGEDADFEEDFDDDDDDDSSSSDDEGADGEVEAEDLEGGAGGPPDASASKKRKAEGEEDTFGRIEHGLSGDEVDAGNIIEGGRRARRGRAGGDGKPKYTAKAEVASDEDSW